MPNMYIIFMRCILFYTLQVASWSYGGQHVRLENGSSEIDLSMYNENGQWLILETSSRRDVVDTGEATFDMIIMELKLQRKPIFYLLNVIVPCTVISTTFAI